MEQMNERTHALYFESLRIRHADLSSILPILPWNLKRIRSMCNRYASQLCLIEKPQRHVQQKAFRTVFFQARISPEMGTPFLKLDWSMHYPLRPTTSSKLYRKSHQQTKKVSYCKTFHTTTNNISHLQERLTPKEQTIRWSNTTSTFREPVSHPQNDASLAGSRPRLSLNGQT